MDATPPPTSLREDRAALAAAVADLPAAADRRACLDHLLGDGVRCLSLAEVVLTGPMPLLEAALAVGLPVREFAAPVRTSEPFGAVPGLLHGEANIYLLPAVHGLPGHIEALHGAGVRFSPPGGPLVAPSPLVAAAKRCAVDPAAAVVSVVAPLVDVVGVDPDLPDARSGRTALGIVCAAEPSLHCTAFARELVDRGAGVRGQHLVASLVRSDNLELFRALLRRLTPDELNEAGQATPLGYAVSRRSPGFVDALLDAGAGVDPDKAGTLEMAPLHHAAEGFWPEMVELLLRRGADPDVGWPKTPLVAVLKMLPPPVGNVFSSQLDSAAECIEMLLDAGASPDAPGALALAIKRGGARIVGLLLARGADPSPRGPAPHALHDAVSKDPDPAVVAALVVGGARSTHFLDDADPDSLCVLGPLNEFAQTIAHGAPGLRGPCSAADNPAGRTGAIAAVWASLVAAGDDPHDQLCTQHAPGVLFKEMLTLPNGDVVPWTPYNLLRVHGDDGDPAVAVFGELQAQNPWPAVASKAPHDVAAFYLRTTRVPPEHILEAAGAAGTDIARLAALPWSPLRHRYFCADFRATVVQLLLVALRVRRAPVSPLHAVMARLPREMWFAIVAHLPR